MRVSYYIRELLNKPSAQYARDYLGITALPGAGDILGPAGAGDRRVAIYDGITGKMIQNSLTRIEADGRVSNVTDPTGLQDVATKNYVDSKVGGIGASDPEGVVSSNPGMIYFATTSRTLWVKETGSGDTGWTQLI